MCISTTKPLGGSNGEAEAATDVGKSGADLTEKTTGTKRAPTPTELLPWWRRGGMHIIQAGQGLIIFIVLFFLSSHLVEEERKMFGTLLLAGYAASFAVGCRTVYCILIVPTYMTSLLLSLRLEGQYLRQYHELLYPALLILAAFLLAVAKVNICMSVCLHRYAAHLAFKCGPITQAALAVLSCLANQGGPIWWASQHRCHHKHCDVPRDPHSPAIDGTEKAFSFFERHEPVEEEFAPRHLEGPWMRLLDTWAWIPCALELLAANALLGRDGLFVAFTSGWISQSVTLWFNIANHPPEIDTGKDCKATDGKVAVQSYYLPFHLLDVMYGVFGVLVAETEHEHHHDYPQLAKRKPEDLAYWTFIFPLEKLGLVWDVNK